MIRCDDIMKTMLFVTSNNIFMLCFLTSRP